MNRKHPLVYLNGRMIPASQAQLAIFDAGVVQGAIVTEQTRTFRGKPFRLKEHLDRLLRSLQYARMDPGLTKTEWTKISLELITHNRRLIDDEDDLGLIQFVTPGEYPTYASMTGRPARTTPTVCVHTFPLPFELWASRLTSGIHLVTSSIRHIPSRCYDQGMKCRSRMHFYLADREVRESDPEASALLLDLDDNVTETSTSNFLIVQGDAILSPRPVDILPGVSRAVVLELARKMGIAFVERDLSMKVVMNSDEAFLSSTPNCLMPVTRINGTKIGAGKPGPVYRRLLDAWSRKVKVDIERQIVEGAIRHSARR